MLAPEAKRRKVRSELKEFLGRFAGGADKTRGKFFPQAVAGILLAGSLMVRRWCRWVTGDRCRHPFYRQKRLLNQLHSRDWDHAPLLSAYRHWAASMVQPDTALVIDLTDIAKARARKLPYLARVRDGSDQDHRLVNGYWCVEVYARLPGRKMLPLVLHPYSIEDPQVLSENQQVLAAVERVMAATGGRGVLVMDIGGDREELLLPWVDDERLFVVRQRGDRLVLLGNGPANRSAMSVADVAERLLHRAAPGRLAWTCVYLPQRPQVPLALVVHQSPGYERPMMLLSSLAVPSQVQAQNVRTFYRQRHGCEEAVQFLKQQVGLEGFAIRRYESFDRLFMLAMWAMAFLTWLLLERPRLLATATGKCPGSRQAKFVYYRALRFIQELQELAFTLGLARLPPARI
jgi:hypothetical protein